MPKTTPKSSPSTLQQRWQKQITGSVSNSFYTRGPSELPVNSFYTRGPSELHRRYPKEFQNGEKDANHGPLFLHGKSVNDGVDTDMASLSHIKVEEIATRAALVGSLLAKFDIEKAYRIVPVHPDNKHLLDIVCNAY